MAKSLEEMKAEARRKREEPLAAASNGHNAEPPPKERQVVTRPARKSVCQNQDSPVFAGRTLPHSVEAEQGVLGSMLISRDAIAEAVTLIDDAFFYIPAHQTIYTELVTLWNAGKEADLITFTQVLRDKNLLDAVGGAAFVTSLFTFVPTAAMLTYYLEIVREKYVLRQLIACSTESIRRAYEEQDDVNALLDDAEGRMLSIGDDRSKEEVRPMKENVMDALEQLGEAYENRGGITGLATGFAEFDRMTGGLHNSEMIVIAARPSVGKTAMAMNIAEHVAVEGKRAVAVFSLEMSTDQLTQRMLCSRARVNLQKLREGLLAERDFPNLTSAASKLAETKLLIDDSSGMSILELRAKARRMKSKHGIELVVVDYLQLLRSTTKRSQENRQVEVSEISSGLKSLAKELNLPVIVLAQLNRQPEGRHGGRPRLSDLRESGSIEQDADLVGLLYRAELYEEDEEERAEKAGEAELIIAKQRNGPVCDVNLTFLKEFTRFEDRAIGHQPD